MVKKTKKASDIRKKINEAKKEKRLLIGTKSVKKAIKGGKIAAVIYASNCPESIERELSYYSKISKAEVEKSSHNSAKLGEICGKPFSILVLGIAKQSK